MYPKDMGNGLKNGITFGILMIIGVIISIFSSNLYDSNPYLVEVIPYLSFMGILLLSPIFLCRGTMRDYLPWLCFAFVLGIGLYLLAAPFLSDLPNYMQGNIKTVDGVVESIQASTYDENTEDPNDLNVIQQSNKENIFINGIRLVSEGNMRLNPQVALHKHYRFEYLPNTKWVISYTLLDVPPKGTQETMLQRMEPIYSQNIK